ncbi:unannotated protein [freshwater metagenome]|uniref:Unannotated protein n=1 Tax=freshwater metagenome TaxID=449393 RepID=A0A6J7QED1_9ZZZZ
MRLIASAGSASGTGTRIPSSSTGVRLWPRRSIGPPAASPWDSFGGAISQPAVARSSPSRTSSSATSPGSTPRTPMTSRTSQARARSSPPSRPRVPVASATSWPPSRASRMRSSGPRCRACSCARAVPGPARPSSRCTVRPTCCTPTAFRWMAKACSSSARTDCSSRTSNRCCRRSARPASRWPCWPTSSTTCASRAATSSLSRASRATSAWCPRWPRPFVTASACYATTCVLATACDPCG